MKRLTVLAMFIAIILGVNAQYKMQVWMNGSALDFPVSQVDSITFVKDTSDTPDVPNPDPNPNPSNGIGVFSVSATKQVTFSPGNLQYHPANDEWRFAANQTDYMGEGNSNISATYDGWIDLFGWGTGNAPTKSSTDCSDYQTFVDWGTNKIGADAPNTWRTLSKDEWVYIFYNRPNAQSLFALGSVNGVNGTIILPDNWTTPAGVSFVASTTKGLYWNGSYYRNGNEDNYSHNTYTSEQWSKMEQAGAVFLPASGSRWYTGVDDVGNFGGYWSSTEGGECGAYGDFFSYISLNPQVSNGRTLGYSVRLVKDIATNDTTNTPTDPYNGHEYVDLGLSVKWATCNVGANAPEEYGDYFAWGETQTKSTYDWTTYKWCNGSYDTQTKYCTNGSYGTVDNKTVLDKEDDAAAVNWGGAWRMPTDAELTELREQCTWTWTSKGSVNGYQVTGPNGNSIFLPAAGYRNDSSLSSAGRGCYGSSSLYTDYPYGAYGFGFGSDDVVVAGGSRSCGQSVRPVCQ